MQNLKIKIMAILGLFAIGSIPLILNANDNKVTAEKFFQKLTSGIVEDRPADPKEVFEKITFVNPDTPLKGNLDTDMFRPGVNQKLARLDEQDYQIIRRDITLPLMDMIKSQKISQLSRLGLQDNNNGLRSGLDLIPRRNKAGISEYDWNISHSNSKKNVISNLSNYKEVLDVDVFGYSVKSHKADRDLKNYAMRKAEILVRFDIRGLNKKGHRQHDRGSLKLKVEKKNDKWKLNAIDVLNGETLVAKRAPQFENITANSVPEIKTYVRGEAIRRGGYALSAADFNGDGNADLYVGAMGSSQLFLGNGKGKYTELKDTGLKNETLVKTAVFGDFFNKGRKDLLLVRFSPTQNGSSSDDMVFYRNIGNNKFVQDYGVKDRERSDYAMPAAVSDFNGDGFLDIYVGFPGARDFTFLQGSLGLQNANNGKPAFQGLFFNDQKGSFVRSKKFSKLSYRDVNTDQTTAPHSSVAADYDLDGDMDIFVVDDRGNLSPVYRNDGKGNFTQVSEVIGLANHQYGMGSAIGDLDGDGHMDMVLTNVNFHAATRINNSAELNYDLAPVKTGLQGVRIAKGRNGHFADITNITGIDWPGEGIGGVEMIDYNNDGHLDIYIANGLWSGTKKGQDLGSWYMRYVWKMGHKSGDEMSELDAFSDLLEEESEEAYTDARSHFMNVLAKYKGDVVGNQKSLKARPSLAGFQRNRLYRNNGDGTYTEVGFLEGVDSIADGYIIAKTDINNDGKMDFILRNGDPGSVDVKFSPVEVYLNKTENDNSVILTLKGSTSNLDAIGSTVTAKVGKRNLVRHLIANNGTAQSQNILHFGLDEKEKIDVLTVRWPNGKEETWRDLQKGRHTIIEGTSSKKFAGK